MPAVLPSITWRVTRTLLLISLLWALLVAAVVRQVVHHETDELMDQGLRATAEILQGVLVLLPEQGPPAELPHTSDEKHLVWQVVDAQTGTVLRRSHLAPGQALLRSAAPDLRSTPDGDWRVMTVPMQRSGSPHFLLVAQREDERVEARAEATIYTLISALLMGVIATALMNLLVRRELLPLGELSRAVKHFDPLQARRFAHQPERAELVPIAQAIHDLGERLARRIDSERAFATHAAHALRTPLAGIDAQLAIALKEAPESLRPRLVRSRKAASRLSRVMQALLTMFRSGSEPHLQMLRISEWVTHQAYGDMRIDIDSDALLQADPDLLAAVLFNLLDNAQQHAATRVLLTATSDAGVQRLRILDNGTGCSPAELEPLRRAVQGQDPVAEAGLKGLGLMLAKLVVRAHGGQMALPSVEQGFCVELSWPVLAQP